MLKSPRDNGQCGTILARALGSRGFPSICSDSIEKDIASNLLKKGIMSSLNPQLKNQLLIAISSSGGDPEVFLTSESLAMTPLGKGNLSKKIAKSKANKLDYGNSRPRPLSLTANLFSQLHGTSRRTKRVQKKPWVTQPRISQPIRCCILRI